MASTRELLFKAMGQQGQSVTVSSETSFSAEDYRQTNVTSNLQAGLPILYLEGDTSGMSKDDEVDLNCSYESVDVSYSGTCSVKWQGASSSSYPKKNYTVKFEDKFDVGWGEEKKYCFKANYVDPSHAMNIVAANLWADLVEDRGTAPMLAGPNNGAMDGFPCIIILNDEFHGLYTMNIPKDEWAFGMGDSTTEYIVTAEEHTDATQFKDEALLDGTDFDYEYVPDDVDEDTVKTSLNTAINAIIGSTGSGWEDTVDTYFDVDTAVDYMIFTALLDNIDGYDKNFILCTYDGVKWYFSAYDLDAIFGQRWTGTAYYIGSHSDTSFSGLDSRGRMYHLIYTYSPDKLKERYHELREGIFSEDQILYRFSNFIEPIPRAVYNAENEKWPLLPGTSSNTLGRIVAWYRQRCEYLDAEIDEL